MKQFIAGFLIAAVIALYWSSTLRSDVREMRKMKDSLIVKNNELDNTVKTQCSDNEALKACIVSKDKTIAAKCATINTQTVLIGKTQRQLIASQENNRRLRANYAKKYTKKKSKSRKIYKKPAKTRNQVIAEREIARLTKEKSAEQEKYKGYKKSLKRLKDSIGGSPKSQKGKAEKIKALLSKITKCKTIYAKKEKRIASLKSRSY